MKHLKYFLLILVSNYNLYSQELVATLTLSPTTQDLSNFGNSIDITKDGNYIVSGAYRYDTTNENAGLVQVFKKNGDNWDLILSDSGLDNVRSQFGEEVAITRFNDLIFIAVGAKQNEIGTNIGYVKLYVYDINASAFTSTGLDLNGDGDLEDANEGQYFVGDGTSDYFGNAISFSGDGSTMAISGTGYEPGGGLGSNNGHVRVYKYQNDINKTWREITTIDQIIGTSTSLFGQDIALNGDGTRLLATSSALGFFEVYDFDGSDWTVVGTTSTTFDEDNFIISGFKADISSDGNRLIISAAGYDDPGTNNNIGSVKIYNFDNTQPSKWNLSATITGTTGTNFGYHLDLSEDGSKFVVSGYGFNNRDLYTTTDGVNWTASNLDFGNAANFQPMKVIENLIIVSHPAISNQSGELNIYSLISSPTLTITSIQKK